jgi:hypothetical protein
MSSPVFSVAANRVIFISVSALFANAISWGGVGFVPAPLALPPPVSPAL